ncbi:MAG: PLP-dependent aminotransferase family protein [Granulosicoccus sp.]
MSSTPEKNQLSDFRYEELADFIATQIYSGVLPHGSKVPSLRKVSKGYGVSVSTALHAYRLLESRGLLEAVPQSGYIVRATMNEYLTLTQTTAPLRKKQRVEVSVKVNSMLDYAADRSLIPLGCAIPSPDYLAASKLDRFLAKAARTRGTMSNTYSPPKGELDLRLAIARRAMLWGEQVNPDDIVISCGCTEALVLALRSVTSPGDTVAVESPTYFGILQILESLNLRALEVPTHPTEGIDSKALDSLLGKHKVSTCLVSSGINNPLGYKVPEKNKRAHLRILNKHKIPLIEDDVYGDIYFSGSRPKPYCAMKEATNTIYCSSFSKTVAPGYRIGWATSKIHSDRICNLKVSTTLANPVLTQSAMADYLDCGAYDNHLRKIRRIFELNVERMIKAVADYFPSDTRVSQPEGGFVLWVELGGTMTARQLFEQAIKQNICFTPGDLFSAQNQYDRCLRLNCGYPWNAEMEQALKTLGALVSSGNR